jgi:phosphate transport system permease protein
VAAAPDSERGPDAGTSSARGRVSRRVGNGAFQYGTGAVSLLVLAAFVVLIVILVDHSELAFTAFGPGFLTGLSWNTNAHPPVYGGAPYIEGTLITSAIALLLGVPVSLGIAVFLSELSPTWLRDPLSSLVELLAAIPSVIYGLWGLFVLVPVMKATIEPSL